MGRQDIYLRDGASLPQDTAYASELFSLVSKNHVKDWGLLTLFVLLDPVRHPLTLQVAYRIPICLRKTYPKSD